MKSLSLKRDSWHYKLAGKFGWEEGKWIRERVSNDPHTDEYYDTRRVWVGNDFCSYVRRILLGCITAIMATVLALSASGFYLLGQYVFFTTIYDIVICGNIVPKVSEAFPPMCIINVLTSMGVSFWLVKTDRLTIFAIPDWIKWCFRRVPNPSFNIPKCDDIPICDDTRRFLLAAWETFHDKVCFKLEFHKNDDNVNQG